MLNEKIKYPYASFIDSNDVRLNTGYRLEDILLDAEEENAVDNALREIARMIYDKLPPFERRRIYADPANKEALARCQMYQIVYILENNDISTRNGIGIAGPGLVSLDDLRGWRVIAPSVYEEFMEHGWLYRGVSCL